MHVHAICVNCGEDSFREILDIISIKDPAQEYYQNLTGEELKEQLLHDTYNPSGNSWISKWEKIWESNVARRLEERSLH